MGIMLILCQNGVPGVNLKGHSNSEHCGISMFGIRLCNLNLKKIGWGDLCVSNTSQQSTPVLYFSGLFDLFYSIKTYQTL